MYLSDADSERGLLSILINNSKDVYIELSDLGITSNTFVMQDSKAIYECIRYCFEKNDNISLDVPMIISASKGCGYQFWFDDSGSVEILEEIIALRANSVNGRIFGKKLRKLEVARNVIEKLDEAKDTLLEFQGDETIGEIFGVVERTILNMSANITSEAESPIKVSDVIDEYIQDKIDNPIEQVGISSGFARFDECMGGGLRNGSIYVVGARAKGGKSLFLNAVGSYVAKILDIPVLYVFLEMSWQDQVDRMLAAATNIPARSIETGKFAQDPNLLKKIKEEIIGMKSSKFYCKSIAGRSIEDQLNLMRRWLVKEVGLNNDGTAKPCLIAYDYVRLPESSSMKNMQETQAIGFLLEQLSHFVTKYQIPMLTAAQLNRSGLEKSDESAIGISDRISWLCAGVALLQSKSEAELALEGHSIRFGNKKLTIPIARYGPATQPGDYINCFMKKETCSITEGITAFEAAAIAQREKEYDTEDELNNSDVDDRIIF